MREFHVEMDFIRNFPVHTLRLIDCFECLLMRASTSTLRSPLSRSVLIVCWVDGFVAYHQVVSHHRQYAPWHRLIFATHLGFHQFVLGRRWRRTSSNIWAFITFKGGCWFVSVVVGRDWNGGIAFLLADVDIFQCVTDTLRVFCVNPSRMRRRISKLLLMWENRYDEVWWIMLAVTIVVVKWSRCELVLLVKLVLLMPQVRALRFVLDVKLFLMETFVKSGFSLELYAFHEYPQIFSQLYFLHQFATSPSTDVSNSNTSFFASSTTISSKITSTSTQVSSLLISTPPSLQSLVAAFYRGMFEVGRGDCVQWSTTVLTTPVQTRSGGRFPIIWKAFGDGKTIQMFQKHSLSQLGAFQRLFSVR